MSASHLNVKVEYTSARRNPSAGHSTADVKHIAQHEVEALLHAVMFVNAHKPCISEMLTTT
jgi:hypothetical protein